MTKDDDFKLLKIQTHVLRVNIHCDGCKDKVKKLLTKIEGVFSVTIDVEHQKVTVVGSVNADTLIRKLSRSGKHSEIWSNKPNNQSNHKQSNNAPQKNQKQNNNQHQKHNQISTNQKDQGNKNNLMQGLKVFKNQHKGGKVPDLYSDDDFDEEFDDDDDDFDEEDFKVLNEKMGQLNFLKQQMNGAHAGNNNGGNNGNAKKNSGGNGHGNLNNGKNNQNQLGKNANVPSGLNFGGGANGKMMPNFGALGGDHAKRVNGLNGMHGMNAINGMPGLHGNPSFQAAVGGAGNHQSNGMMMGGMHHHHPSTMAAGNNNMRNGNMMMMHDGARYMQQQQPQMMYARSPQVMPYTGYYGYNPNPNVYYGYNNYYASPYHGESSKNSDGIGYMFSDENTTGCSIM
ncbi:RNA polymerase II degradation factor 1-like protein [Carex littledalei]|uniref:RNA polymerase II degradation factor 1-like protein n=1 Tax=Carex littledalei TaxID=544730 RepID=A0A833QLK5_9POAL|nr:RNA polymerase II degradation factor 1-like protein [Carex littledalei]